MERDKKALTYMKIIKIKKSSYLAQKVNIA